MSERVSIASEKTARNERKVRQEEGKSGLTSPLAGVAFLMKIPNDVRRSLFAGWPGRRGRGRAAGIFSSPESNPDSILTYDPSSSAGLSTNTATSFLSFRATANGVCALDPGILIFGRCGFRNVRLWLWLPEKCDPVVGVAGARDNADDDVVRVGESAGSVRIVASLWLPVLPLAV